MPTPRLIGAQRAQLTTPGFFWSADYSCADNTETYFYWFNNSTGDLYRAQLPNLANKTTITTIANPSSCAAMRAHPTDPNLLVYFNKVDGVNTINTSTGAVVQVMTLSAFNTMVSVNSDLNMNYLENVRIRGSKLLLHGGNDPSGSVWEYDVGAGTANLVYRNNALGRGFDLGPDTTREFVLTGYDTPSMILYIIDLLLGQVRMLAGIGTGGSIVDGNAYTTANFNIINKVYRAASDLYYVRDDNDYIRWIQGGSVGSYSNWTLGGRFICQYLPIRNLVVSVGIQDITVWE